MTYNLPRHIINTQRLDLTVHATGKEARALQDAISVTYRRRVMPLLEKIFDGLCREDEMACWEKLELDIGTLSADSISTQFPERVEAELTRILRDRLASARAVKAYKALPENHWDKHDGVRLTTLPVSRRDRLIHFLRTGQRAWNTGKTESRLPLADQIRACLADDPAATRGILGNELRQSAQRKRLIHQCPDTDLTGILPALFAANDAQVKSVTAFCAAVALLIKTVRSGKVFPRISSAGLRLMIWEEAILSALENPRLFSGTHTGQKTVLEKICRDLFVKYGREEPNASYAVVAIRLSESLQETAIPADLETGKKMLIASLEALAEKEKKSKPDLGSSARSAAQEIHPGKKDTASQQADVWDFEDFENLSHLSHRGNPGHRYPNRPAGEAGTKNLRAAASREEEMLPRHARPASTPFIEEDWISNAGLVLVHPFIPSFLEGLKLVKQKEFVHDEGRQRAIHLLQYLVTGQPATPEEELMLNKLLCGADPTEPVIPGIRITRKEKKECRALLQHVIAQWKVLKNTKPDSLRQTFLQREGHLGKDGLNGGWKLGIERQTFDILLDRLPWGLSIIKMPWNPFILQVEW